MQKEEPLSLPMYHVLEGPTPVESAPETQGTEVCVCVCVCVLCGEGGIDPKLKTLVSMHPVAIYSTVCCNMTSAWGNVKWQAMPYIALTRGVSTMFPILAHCPDARLQPQPLISLFILLSTRLRRKRTELRSPSL